MPWSPTPRLLLLAATLPVGIGVVSLDGAAELDRFAVSIEHPAIEYSTRPSRDPVARLHQRLLAGEATLTFEREQGYLRSVLELLDVPAESQTLVFSKTSLQWEVISPRNPRAIYFNDQVAVAWIRGAPAIEFAALDPEQGVMFYALSQTRQARGFQRPRTCLQCHVSPETLGVPGLAVGSSVTDPTGEPYTTHAVDHRTMIESRWGGWYVTGDTGVGRHVGNTVATDPDNPMLNHDDANLNIDSVVGRFDTNRYLAPYSDIAALMVLEHQTHMTNLITRVGWDFRLAAHENRATGDSDPHDAVRALVDYMLFVDEAPLTDRMVGTSGFADAFVARGPFDRQGRSLRDIDLDRRLFRYPCSYMIYTDAFDALPVDAKAAVYRRLWQVLSGEETDVKYARLSATDRRDVLAILQDTKSDLPSYFTTVD